MKSLGAPLFGSVRYNSAIPIEARFNEIFNLNSQPILYLTKYNSDTGIRSQPILINGEDSDFKFQPLPYGGNVVLKLT